MNASQYPITLKFGATPYPYNSTNKHEGIDRGCPVGTAVIVNGVLIAKSGNTGLSTGPHLHYAKFLNGQHGGGIYNSKSGRTYYDPSDAFGISGKIIFAQLNGTAGQEIIIEATNGFYYRFLHLSEIIMKGGNINVPTKEQVKERYEKYLKIPYTQADLDYYSKQPWSVLDTNSINELARQRDALALSQGEFETINEQLYRKV